MRTVNLNQSPALIAPVMTSVKKLNDILQDTVARAASLAQNYGPVQVRFFCYRNSGLVHASQWLLPSILPSLLPQYCRNHSATGLQVLIARQDAEPNARPLYEGSFKLARTSQATAMPGGYDHGHDTAVTTAPFQYGGLGMTEINGLINKRVSDELLCKEHRDLQQKVAEQRNRIEQLETELEAQVAVNNARNMIKEYATVAAPFAPVLASLLGVESRLGKAVSGLAGLAEADAPNGAATDPNAITVTTLVTAFMEELGDDQRQQLVAVMLRIQQDPGLIPRIAQFVHQQQPA